MRRLGWCEYPIWRVDDFTECFEFDYVFFLLPLVACGLSVLHLLFYISGGIRFSRRGGHILLSENTIIENGYGFVDTLGVEDELAEENVQTSLNSTDSNLTAMLATEISYPRASSFLVVLELFFLIGEIGICLVWLSLYPNDDPSHRAALMSLAVWLYIATLASARLYLQLVNWNPLPKLWNHTAALYSFLWILSVIAFRTVLIKSTPEAFRLLIVAKFVLSTLLALNALTSRIGNRPVLLTRDGKIEPSREPLASLLSAATFSWVDSIIWKGWKKPLEIDDVWNLLPAEKPMVIIATFRRYIKTTGLAIHLIKFFFWDLLYQQFWAAISAVNTFVPTLLLKAILEYVENPEDISKSSAWLYVILLLVSSLLQGVADGQALWRGRKICIKLRSIMIGEIYAKTLRRKTASSGDTDMNDSKDEASGVAASPIAFLKKIFTGNKRRKGQQDRDGSIHEDTDRPVNTQVNSGTIINLMSVDSFRVSEISGYWHFLIPAVPIQLTVAIYLLFQFLGWSAIAGVCVMIAVMPLNMFYSNRFSRFHKRIMAATDARIHSTNEVLQNVRIIKFFAWEERFATQIQDKRIIELAAVRARFILWTCAAITWFSVPMIITAFSFFLYTYVEHKPLFPSVAFTALSLFSLLRFPLDRLADMTAHVLESRVSVMRVEKFLEEEETGKYEQLIPSREGRANYIGFKNATFSWGAKDEPVNSKTPSFRMLDLNIAFKKGGLNVVAGPTGAGKTSLLMALLGEMTILEGSVHLPGGYDMALLQADGDGLTESVAFCAQQAWLVNDTIKENILFASSYNENRYKDVIHACALERDLEVLEAGDNTLVGEKGIVVSGGQKQRISLARALYSNARYILLDDCLSAVDSHTAQHIFEHCIKGPLMAHRTCILVTHNIALCVPMSDHVVVLANGKIAGQGTPKAVMSSGVLGDDFTKSQPMSQPSTSENSRSQSFVDFSRDSKQPAKGSTNGNAKPITGDKNKLKGRESDVKNANTRTESKVEGAVDWRVIRLYLSSMGPWYFWVLILAGFAAENATNVSTNVWIRQWANSYSTSSEQSRKATNSTSQNSGLEILVAPFNRLHLYPVISNDHIIQSSDTSAVNVLYYLGVYVLLASAYIVICLLRLGAMFKGSLTASHYIHDNLLTAVLRAKFKFFDTTPLGQIMNRFSKDLQAIDQDIAPIAAGVLQCCYGIVSIVILISIITPGFLIAAVLLTCVYVTMATFYIQSSRDLKRLESTQRSPLFQQFGETLSGVTTIRAYGHERRFIEDNARRISTYNRPFIYLWAANRWLALRVDFAGALVSFFAATFIVLHVGRIDAGAAGLSLTYALGFNDNVLWLVRLYSENEQNMNHVERLKTFLEVEQEAPAHRPEMKPMGAWPTKGAVRFENYSTRYRPDLDPVLKNLTFDIQGQEKVGIVGRTGAGKSSLALALFRGLEADSGRIYIDDVDVGLIGLQDLRENLTIVPQDPTLFTGTIRSNLDPFGLFTDEEIFTSLRRVQLIGSESGEAAENPTAQGKTVDHAQHMSVGSTFLDPEGGSMDELDASGALTDLSAPAPIRRGSLSVSAVTGEDPNSLSKVLTNTRENANIFLNLSSPVAESGTNLSQGQRQLLCLARALLKAPRVLLMDEATASIDYATDAKIQDTLRELKGSTIITIAHRLQTVIDYDKVMVLEKGELAEYGPPCELISNMNGIFRSMCEQSGDFDTLMQLAQNANRKNNLVDIDE